MPDRATLLICILPGHEMAAPANQAGDVVVSTTTLYQFEACFAHGSEILHITTLN